MPKPQYKMPFREFIGGPWDGDGCPGDHEQVFYDPQGVAHFVVRTGTSVLGEYQLDFAAVPPVWRWARKTEESR